MAGLSSAAWAAAVVEAGAAEFLRPEMEHLPEAVAAEVGVAVSAAAASVSVSSGESAEKRV